MHVPPVAFFIAKYFGSGVIIATAFIHVSCSGSAVLHNRQTNPVDQEKQY